MEDKELLPCPFCGSKDVGGINYTASPAEVHCYGCNAIITGNGAEAIRKWNTRATPQISGLKQVREALDALLFIKTESEDCASEFSSEIETIQSALDGIIAGQDAPTRAPQGCKVDMWTLPYDWRDSDERIRKVIATLGLPENSTGVWGSLKQFENEIRHDVVEKINTAAPTPAQPEKVDVEALRWQDEYPGIIGDEPLYEVGFEQGFAAAIAATCRLKV